MLALIGSKALRQHRLLNHLPQDTDLVGTYDEVMAHFKTYPDAVSCYPISDKTYVLKTATGHMVEAEIAWEGSTAEELCALIDADPMTLRCKGINVASLDVLYMLKMSHRYLRNSPYFLKTMRDIKLMREYGANIKHPEFYAKRMKETYAYSHPDLNVSKGSFFTGDGVQYVYDHDSIHKAMAHLRQPAYKFYQPEESEVRVTKDLFFAQRECVRLFGVLEEAYVLALERSQIPYKDKGVTPKKSFDMALMKVCSSITSGWFREFAWENYDAVQEFYQEDYLVYQEDYVTRFWAAVEGGFVELAPKQ